MAVALIVAAGRGERLGSSEPKALAALAGRPLLEWSVEAVRAVPAVERIVVALPPGAEAPPGTVGVAGGTARSLSVRAALAEGAGDPVLVHDAARPLAAPELFVRVLDELAVHGCDCVIAAVPVTDTIKEADPGGGLVRRTLDRSLLWAVQTPQAFRREALERALAQPDEQLAAATDDAWLVEGQGGSVRVLESSPENIKVTTPRDLRLAELMLADRC
ncbi:MAG: 2-C-methyl-D-erythritol 4-phosphate cytidylyltransferase [Solirubrobacteraceae bacterium]|nr:2-C-methyl-D-erythritol 4-phosphate cytidylyltransferase [Solirubrobacteraceae bacterium]